MLLAQWLILFGEERLTLQTVTTYRAHKAGVMPGVAQGFKKPVSSFNGEFTAIAHGTKEGVVICLTIGISIFQMEDIIANGIMAGHTYETGNMPGLFQSIDYFSKYLPLASRTFRGKELLIADLAIESALLFHKPNVGHRGSAVSTVKLLWMPGFPQCHQERSPNDLVTLGTHRSTLSCWNMLCSLHQSVLLCDLRLCHGLIAWCSCARRCHIV